MLKKMIPLWIKGIDWEDIEFIKNFIIESGSLKKIAKTYNVSYSTVRTRLNDLIHKIKLFDNEDEPQFNKYIKKLVIEGKLDVI